jgi:hypothetical protein
MIAFALGFLPCTFERLFPSCMFFVFRDGCMLLRYSSARLTLLFLHIDWNFNLWDSTGDLVSGFSDESF